MVQRVAILSEEKIPGLRGVGREVSIRFEQIIAHFLHLQRLYLSVQLTTRTEGKHDAVFSGKCALFPRK